MAVPTITPPQAEKLLDDLCDIIARASAATVAVPVSDIEQRTKDDKSPVTAADEASEAIILEGLDRLCPGVPVLAEESAAAGRLPDDLSGSFFCVDPLDGTKEFIAGRNEFTVNIALITDGVPILGIITAPKQNLLWRGVVGSKAERLTLDLAGTPNAFDPKTIRARTAPPRLKVAASRSHLDPGTEALMATLPVGETYQCGSSVKFCHLAEGLADLYPRLSPTCEWDIAAGCAILAAAGGRTVAPDGGALKFGGNSSGKFLVPGFIAMGRILGDPDGVPIRFTG